MIETYELTSEQVNSRVTNVRLIAKHIDKWQHLAPYLKLTKQEITNVILKDRHDDEQCQREMMLNEWIKKNGSNASYQCLLNVCVEADDKELAENICKELKRQGMYCR